MPQNIFLEKKAINKLISLINQSTKFNGKYFLEENDRDFYKLYYTSLNSKNCPFSLWVEKGNSQNIFFMIGDEGFHAALIRYVDLDVVGNEKYSMELINTFLSANIQKTLIFCNKQLIKVRFQIISKEYVPTLTCLVKSYLFCFNKTEQKVQYEPWLIN